MPGHRQEGASVRLVRELNLLDCFSLVVGVIIGSGIFISPKGVLLNVNTVGWFLLIWLFAGIFNCLGALSYVELATSIPLSGGDYTYLRLSFGYMIAFLRVWTLIVAVRTGPLTLLSITAGTYIVGDSAVCLRTAVRIFAACILCLVAFLNSWSVKLSKRVQNICTFGKISGLIVIIVTGLIKLSEGNTSSFQNMFQKFEGSSSAAGWQSFPTAVYSGVFAFSGWQYLPQVTEEIVEPGKTMPAAISLAMLFVTTIYLLTNTAFLSVLTPSEILDSDAVAMTFGKKALGNFWWLMPLSVILSCLGSINGSVFATARTFFVASREGQFPQVLGMIHVRRRTPLPAVAILLPVCLMMLTVDDIYSLINYLSFSRWLFIGMTCASVPYFRWKYPHIDRPFKVHLLIPVTFSLCAFTIVITSALSDPAAFFVGLGITVLGVPVYITGVLWQNKPRSTIRLMRWLTITLQKLFLIVDTTARSGVERTGSRESLLGTELDEYSGDNDS
ncbi:Cystine/glutamate transporter [Holothuria leucospilota]|uniref:Cystine/glutamate transporter n=1 Tax=Holothuria leucospilota TaxID=206669 RepID=A0A9Q1CBS0_HOLLE|nr:Cystine/glutamate transporter [Holothuria leucospilota]